MAIDSEEFKVEPDEDDGVSVLSLAKHLEDDSERNKNRTAQEFDEFGGQFLNEIDKKKKRRKVLQVKLIPYILKHAGDTYEEDELNSYTLEDVQDIYEQVKKEKRPFIVKFFNFLFNFE